MKKTEHNIDDDISLNYLLIQYKFGWMEMLTLEELRSKVALVMAVEIKMKLTKIKNNANNDKKFYNNYRG